ncbi:HK97 family phage prohead protease [Orientia tsutsugamushi]|uniref:Peptidase U35 n=1 Tax=Orientia tsutsugamushi TaxID=784 RepID=A0A2U3RT49_ORITS|nr:HK97 family phage prohead protease [Orientia tsutsugamushi]KJV57218.1 phage prohead protease, HK97 family [Orientia tsutsugamushi str. Karp]SPR16318.1 peptidase U35 [Orientia tsutsugamushi]
MDSNNYKTNLIIKAVNHDNVIISGYATVFNLVDSSGDYILKGAFKNIHHRYLSDIKLLWQHNIASPIGLITNIEEDEYGVRVDASINQHIQKGKEAIALIQQGVINNFSIGFTIEDSSYNRKGNRIIKSALLWEVSLVTFPANKHAKIRNCKHASQYDVISSNQLVTILNSLIEAQKSLNNITQ